jgi:3-phosphoshikimate 1-carboxyvinyltransferase
MKIAIKPSIINGTMYAPPSKSVMQRACALALLRNGTTILHQYGHSNDDKAALNIIQQLGARVTYINDNTLSISSDGSIHIAPDSIIDCGESGLSLRMFAPIIALHPEPVTITGHGSLLQRPIDFMHNTLRELGVKWHYEQDHLPITFQGPIQIKDITVDGSLTSQLLTGLIITYSYGGEKATIQVSQPKSTPYLALTLQVMEQMGFNIPTHQDFAYFHFEQLPHTTIATPLEYTIEGDWSNGAFLLVAGAIAGEITLKGLDVFSSQADKKILEALQDFGCLLSIQTDQIIVKKAQQKAFHFDATHCPDLFPPLVALAAYANGTSVISGVHRLHHKESNRAATLQQEFKKLGLTITLQDDNMIIYGTGALQGGTLSSHNDHRIAMAVAIAGLAAQDTVIVNEAEAVNKSYPAFYQQLQTLTTSDHIINWP